jgi:uncharacterized protein
MILVFMLSPLLSSRSWFTYFRRVWVTTPSFYNISMKMQPDQSPGINIITAYDALHFAVNGQRFAHAVLLPAQGDVQVWRAQSFQLLTVADFEAIAALNTELVILGTGKLHRFVRPEYLAPLLAKRIGIEAMNTGAALRTYNILAGEGRSVAAALLLDI